MSEITTKKILVVYAFDPQETQTIKRWTHQHHLRALEYSTTGHEIVYYNVWDDLKRPWNIAEWSLAELPHEMPTRLRGTDFDVVILHYSFLAYRWFYPTPVRDFFYGWKIHFGWIGEMQCVKIAIPQDEADHCEVLDEWLFEWGISAVLTNFGAEGVKVIYPLLSQCADFYSCHPGYIDDETAAKYKNKLTPLKKRPLDIAYRARHLPYWVGERGQMKWIIGDAVSKRAAAHGLKVDISTRPEDTIFEGWFDFLASSKATLGCEGGFSAPNWRGEYRFWLNKLMAQNPAMTFEQFSAQMPPGWDGYEQLAITGPRHFDAVFTKTCQILVEGHYRGALQADKHYIPLKRDFSNLDEVLEKLKDVHYVEEVVERAYADIYLSGEYTYRKFVELIEMAIFNAQYPLQKKMDDSKINLMTTNENAVQALERALVAERHSKAFLEAKLLENAIQALERALVAERHSKAFLEAKLLENAVQALERALVAERHSKAFLEAKLLEVGMMMNTHQPDQQTSQISGLYSYQVKWNRRLALLVLGSLVVSVIISLVVALWLR